MALPLESVLKPEICQDFCLKWNGIKKKTAKKAVEAAEGEAVMEIVIREARAGDAEALAKLNREEMGYDYPADRVGEKLGKLLAGGKDKILIAELDGQAVGYVHLNGYDVLYADHMKNIMGIAVSRQHRRMGIGGKLLRAAEAWAREDGASGVRLVSGESRKGAHAFYRSLGYEGDKKQLNLKKPL